MASIRDQNIYAPSMLFSYFLTKSNAFVGIGKISFVDRDAQVSGVWSVHIVIFSELSYKLFNGEPVCGISQSEVDIMEYELLRARSTDAELFLERTLGIVDGWRCVPAGCSCD